MKNLRTNSALFGSIQAKDSNGLHLQDDGGNGIFIKAGGFVGIGTTNPSRKLHVEDSHIRVNNDYGLESDGGNSRVVVGNSIISLETSLTEAVRINASGDVGIGTTNPGRKLHVAGNVFVADSTSNAFAPNVIVAGATADVMRIGFDSGGARSNILSGRDSTTSGSTESYLGFETRQVAGGMTEAMRIDSNGNVGIGTRNPESRLTIQSESEDAVDAITLKYEHLTNTASGKEKRIKWRFGDDATANAFSDAGYIAVGKASSWSDSGSRSSYLSFATTLSNTQSEAMRIHSDGQVGIGTTASIGSEKLIVFRGTSSVGNGLQRWNSNVGTSANTVAIMYADGDLSLDGAVTENLSDIRLKENIVDATPKLDDLMKLEVKNFNLIDDNRKKKRIGFIAQEMEKVFPSLVKTFDSRKYDEDGNVISGYEDAKTVRVKMDFAILTKAIQEQQQIIEDLKSQNESLAARITALEG